MNDPTVNIENPVRRVYKQIVIDSNPFRTRAVLIEDGRVVEVFSELAGHASRVGSIFRGRVSSLLPGMGAAFIDIGMDKNAFFSLSDLHPCPGLAFSEAKERNKLRVGQELMVQVTKDPQGSKSARVGTDISLSGHHLVLFPCSDIIGISKNIPSTEERERLRSIVLASRRENTGVIVRTAAEGKDDDAIVSELDRLYSEWDGLVRSYRASSAPKCLLHSDDLIERTLRDLLRGDVARITINDPSRYDKVRAAADSVEPGAGERVFLMENEPNIFETLGIEKQIDDALSRRVRLASGAYIVLDQTEALLSIDVNSGRNVGRGDIQQTALMTNCEAAKEIARQLRLRNVGGIIVVDFIDLVSEEDRRTVVSTLRDALKNDRTTVMVHGMTSLGLVEITRKKLRESLASSMQNECCACSGSGRVYSPESVALLIRARLLKRLISDGAPGSSKGARVRITADPRVIALIRRHMKLELERNSLEGVSLELNDRQRGHIEDFEIKFLEDAL